LSRREFLKLGTAWMAAALSVLVTGCGGNDDDDDGEEEDDEGGGDY
jgi:hypothetical protein